MLLNQYPMKKITEYRKLLNVNAAASNAELKSAYRALVKEWHPDRHLPDSAEHREAEAKSKAIIEAYHFLLSIAPETKAAALPAYTETVNTSALTKIDFENGILTISFADGSAYEYFGVPKTAYQNLVYAPAPTRYARRHIVHQFLYRQVSKKEFVEVQS